MALRVIPDENQPSAAIEIPLEKPLPDYDLLQLDQPTPRDVDGILVSQGFRDLVDDARGILTDVLNGTGFEISQLTGAICPGDDDDYRPGIWIVLKDHNTPPRSSLSAATTQRICSLATQFAKRLGLV